MHFKAMRQNRQTNTIRYRAYGSLCLFSLLVIWTMSNAWADDLSEEKIKAAFTYNFARYTTWPDDAFVEPSSPIELLVFGDETIRKAFAGIHQKHVGKRKLVVRFTESADTVHMIFFGRMVDAAQLAQALEAAKGKAILTIGEKPDFIRHGGAVNIFKKNDRFHFEINPKTVDRQGVKLSSRLMKLAILVEN